MALLATIIGAPLLLEYGDFVGAALLVLLIGLRIIGVP
jgi:hypothetical protein